MTNLTACNAMYTDINRFFENNQFDYQYNENARALTALMERAEGDVNQILYCVSDMDCKLYVDVDGGYNPAYQVFCNIALRMQGRAGADTYKVVKHCIDTLLTNDKYLVTVAWAYINKSGLARNPKKAFEMLTLAEERLSADEYEKYDKGYLYYSLGYCHYYGIGTKVSKEKMLEYFSKGAEYKNKLCIQGLEEECPPDTYSPPSK